MTPVLPSSASNISLSPGIALTTRKNNCLTRCCILRKRTKQILHAQQLILPLSTSVRLFPHIRTCVLQHKPRSQVVVSATGAEVAVEEPEPAVADEDSVEASGDSSVKEDSDPAPSQSKRARPVRKSDMPPVKNEELVPGASFTGKVKSIQPFGAFVDFGAFTDGLVHVSRLSDNFVKDVGSIVSIGQEVKVRLVEANIETGRISLTMRDSDDISKLNQPSSEGDKTRPPRRSTQNPNQRREDGKRTTKFVKGQDLEGTVKNLTRSGAFISLPEGEEGFLPTSEEAVEGFGSIMGGTSLQAGQEVSVRVLRITRGQCTLTMKRDEDAGVLDAKLSSGTVHTATNPFLLAFRQNKDIAAFLNEREKEEVASEITKEYDDVKKVSKTLESVEGVVEIGETEAVQSKVTGVAPETAEVESDGESDKTTVKDETLIETPSVESEVSSPTPVEDLIVDPNLESKTSSSGEVDGPPSEESTTEKTEIIDGIENQIDKTIVKDEVEAEFPPADIENASIEPVEDGSVESVPEQNGSFSGSTEQSSAPLSKETPTKASIPPALVKQLREETGAGMMDCKNALSETGGDIAEAQEYLRKKGLASADKKASRATAEGRIGSYIHDSRIGVLIEVNCETDFVSRGDIFKELVDDLAMQVAACPQVEYLVPDDVPKETVEKEKEIEMQKEDLLSKPEQIRSKIVEGRIKKRLDDLALLEQPYIKNDKVVVKDWVKQTIATIGENIKVKRFVRFNLGEGLEKKSQDFAAEVAAQTAAKTVAAPAKEEPAAVEAKETDEKAPKVAVPATLVKQLRDETGAGMMDCKKALAETEGDLEKAQEYLRKKGLSTADKKSSRIAAEGRIGSYIHDCRIGVLIEVNCETDFVGRSETFKTLADDLAMQVVACPLVKYVSIEDIPENVVKKERELEMQREDILSKPENIRERIVDGRVSKRLGEMALLEQPFIKDDSVLVKDMVKQTVAALGENIKVRRFARFTLGEDTTTSEGKTQVEA